jgi:hypothetical protein
VILSRFAQEHLFKRQKRLIHLAPDVTVSAPPETQKMIRTKHNKYIKILSFD